jgi:hypothetical protein
MNCPNCQQSVQGDAAFCGSCGTRLAKPTMANTVRSVSTEPPLQPTPALAPAGGDAHANGAFSSQAAEGLVARLKGILLSPRTEWPGIANEDTTPAALLTTYVIPLAIIAALVSFIRMSVVGVSLPFGDTVRTPMLAGLTQAVLTCVMAVIGVTVVALIINMLARTFGGTADGRRALQTAAYSLTAAYVGSVLGLLPMGTLLSLLAGLYGIYTLYLGLPVMMRSSPDRAVGYTAAVVICTIILGLILGAATASLGIGRAAGFRAFNHTEDRDAAREQAASTVGNAIGGLLGSDEKGKQGLSQAISALAKNGERLAQQDTQSTTSATSPSTPTAATSANTTSTDSAQPNPVAAVGGLMSALGGALGGPHRHAPVDFHQLEALLPASLPGMSRQQTSGAANQALGIKKTSAKATYRGPGEARAEVNIDDATGVSGLMDLATSIDANAASESDSGFEKDVSLGGRKAHEKYDRNSRRGEISTIVANRFEVDVSGDNVPMEDLEQSLAAVDLKALEAMKDAGATSQ